MRFPREFRLGAGVLGIELVLSWIYFLFPSNVDVQDVIYELFGGGCVVAILWAIRRYRPEPREAWLVFALATAIFVAGDIAFDISPNAPQPAVADYLYLIAYPLFAALPVALVVGSGSHRRVSVVGPASAWPQDSIPSMAPKAWGQSAATRSSAITPSSAVR